VTLFFREISERGGQLSNPLSFDVRVNLETWQESDPPSRPQEVTDWVQEFLAKCPLNRRDEFRATYEERKWIARRLQEYLIDPTDVMEGKLISYADIIFQEGAVSGGGPGCTYRFLHQGREYLVEDLYCPNPDCHCEEVHVEFWECVSRQREGKQRVTVHQRFLGKVTLDGRIEIVEQGECKLDVAEDVLSTWWDRYRDDLAMLKGRYREVKDMGQRSLDAQVSPPARHDTLFDEPSRFDELLGNSVLLDEPQGEKVRVGRNDPCPCGSGKKYKKCCWRNEGVVGE